MVVNGLVMHTYALAEDCSSVPSTYIQQVIDLATCNSRGRMPVRPEVSDP